MNIISVAKIAFNVVKATAIGTSIMHAVLLSVEMIGSLKNFKEKREREDKEMREAFDEAIKNSMEAIERLQNAIDIYEKEKSIANEKSIVN